MDRLHTQHTLRTDLAEGGHGVAEGNCEGTRRGRRGAITEAVPHGSKGANHTCESPTVRYFGHAALITVVSNDPNNLSKETEPNAGVPVQGTDRVDLLRAARTAKLTMLLTRRGGDACSSLFALSAKLMINQTAQLPIDASYQAQHRLSAEHLEQHLSQHWAQVHPGDGGHDAATASTAAAQVGS